MKIAIIGHKRIPSNEGGIEKGVEQHAVRMVQRGNDVTVYNRGGHNVFGKEFDGKKLKKYKGIIFDLDCVIEKTDIIKNF